MKNSTIITITNINGSKSYTLGELAKKIIKYIIAGIFGIIIICFAIIYFLSNKLEDYQHKLSDKISEYQEIEKQYSQLKQTNQRLEEQILNKENELVSIQSKVRDIETLIGIKPKEGLETTERLNLAHTTIQERLLMLNMLPNGYPLTLRGVTSGFGYRQNPITPERKEFHTGIDLRAKTGTPVYATADGIVKIARTRYKLGFGKLIVLSHSLGFTTYYAHLDKILVKTGQFVKKGQKIALSGNTGYSNGPHLHYEVRYIGIALNPWPFMNWKLNNFETIFKKTKKRVKWESLIKGTKWQWTLLKQLSSQKEQKLQEK